MFYRLVRRLFLLGAAVLFRLRVEGAERLPPSGPAIVVAAHRSWLDPACVGGACRRPVRFLIMESVYANRWARWFYRAMGTIPVGAGAASSASALRGALRALARGEVVGVFPEGRVWPAESPGPVQPGAALLALRTGAPVVPLVICGSARAWPHGRRYPGPAAVRVRVGDALEPPPGAGRDAVDELSARIARALGW